MQHITPGIGMEFQVVEDDMRDAFLPTLFQGDMYKIPRRGITSFLVKQAGIALPEPTQNVVANWTASCVITGHLFEALHRTAEFRSGDHAILIGEGREEI